MRGSAEASGERSIAAGGSIGRAFTGDVHYTKFLTLPPEALAIPPQAPPNMSNLPERAGLFVGRGHELARLDEAFEDAGGVVVQAVHGLGGIGKSTLAARWASVQADAYNPVWWITAETAADLDAGLAELTVALQPALGEGLSRRALRDLAVGWLCANDGWLLVLDNVTDPTDVKPLLERARGGRFLITSRKGTGWQGVATGLPLGVLELPQAVELFDRTYRGSADGAEELCRELGCLPLAVGQAGAYCREARIAPRRYLELLTAHPEQLLTFAPEGGRTIARIWQVTLDRLAGKPLAAEVLRVIAWWAPDGIHRSYLEPLGSPPELTEALRLLAAHSMVTLHDDTVSVHRLVQAAARTGDPGNPYRTPELVAAARESAAALLNRVAEDFESTLHNGWFGHVESLCGHIGPRPQTPESILLLVHFANLHIGIDDGQATDGARRAVEAAERVCGRRHVVTLRARRCLAQALIAAEEEDDAVVLLRQDWSTTARVFGRRDPQTFMIRAQLSYDMLRCDDVAVVLRLARKNARRADRVLGADHPAARDAGVTLAALLAHLAGSDPLRYGPDAVGELVRRQDQIAASVHGPMSDKMVALFLGLLRLRAEFGEADDALAAVEQGIASATQSHGALSMTTMFYRTLQVQLLHEFGEADRARTLAELLLTDWERGFATTPAVGFMRKTLADVLLPGSQPD
ncbi:tetratricopeptide repeat protein [Streptomyces sp. NPDC019531]|uniref:tetratricopeptide repeat protein n=1 Tax=Streptomyces sp. NPDC019531 TaxID=3365062 RepID=UPI00384EE787